MAKKAATPSPAVAPPPPAAPTPPPPTPEGAGAAQAPAVPAPHVEAVEASPAVQADPPVEPVDALAPIEESETAAVPMDLPQVLGMDAQRESLYLALTGQLSPAARAQLDQVLIDQFLGPNEDPFARAQRFMRERQETAASVGAPPEISWFEREELAAAAGCKPDEVRSFRHYEDHTVVVVHTTTRCFKVEVPR